MIDPAGLVDAAAALGAAEARRAARRAWLRLGVRAVVLSLVVVVSSAVGAQSARAMSIPWVPPSMGTGIDVRQLITGSSMASAWSGVTVDAPSELPNRSGYSARCVQVWTWGLVGGQAANTGLLYERPGLVNSNCPAFVPLASYLPGNAWGLPNLVDLRCSASGWLKGVGKAPSGGSTFPYTYPTPVPGVASGQYPCPSGEIPLGVRSAGYDGWVTKGGVTFWLYLSPFSVDFGLAALTATSTCYDGSTFATVSASSSGSTVTRPECPAGSSLVGISVKRGDVVVSSWSAPQSDPVAVSCTASGTCAVVVAAAGVPCTSGVSECDWWDAGGSASEASSKGLSCVWLPDPTMALSGGVQLTMMDCSDAKNGGQGGTSGGGGEQSEDQDTNLITKAINAAKSAIVEAVNRVKSAVDSVKSVVEAGTKAIQKAIADGISTVATKLIELIQAVRDGGGGDGGGGGDEGTGLEPGGCNDQQLANPANPVEWVRAGMVCAFVPAPGTVDGLVQQAKDAIGAPVKPWTDAMTSVASAWTAAPAGCQGPAITIPIPTMQPYVLRPLDACQEPMRTVAGLSRVVATVLLLSAAAWSALRAIAAGLGYQS